MIVATAGHIDHGKTLLVKALTGVDTDRLPEERARGISIDLGFAHLPLGEDAIGFVDVPGHERFVRNMLAGVCAIDFALLVVAADDGPMPQTVEHVQILDLLRVPRAAAVVSKIDRVDAGRIAEVGQAVAALLQGTRFAGAPILDASALTGDGVPAVRALLEAEARRLSAHPAIGRHFRFAIDRAFTIAGSGTVVTGAVFNGAVRAGDRVVVSPAGLEARVRGIQVHGRSAERAVAGQRCALNLAGVGPGSARRGDWALAPEVHRPTQRLDARVKVLASEAKALEHWTPVHLHLATSDVTARVAARRGEAIRPGESAVVQLVLDRPIGALRGDRFILRDQSALRTVGGGFVLDPFAPASRRGSAARIAALSAFEHEAPEEALRALAADAGRAIDLGRFEAMYGVTRELAARLYERVGLVELGRDLRVGITRERVEQVRATLLARLAQFHREEPRAIGQEVEPLRARAAPDLPGEAFATVLRGLVDERRIDTRGSIVRLADHDATANQADDRLWRRVRPALEASGAAPPPVPELAARLRLPEAAVKDFLFRKARTGEVHRIGQARFFTRAMVARLAAIAQDTARARPDGRFTAAQFRDAAGVNRSLAVEILEYLDTLGITRRIGDARVMRKDHAAVLGADTPPLRHGNVHGKMAP